jgi:mRNA interferase RelE/StbE
MSIKFLEKSSSQEVQNIRTSIKLIILAVEEQGIIPFTQLDIKKMKGDWEGFEMEIAPSVPIRLK